MSLYISSLQVILQRYPFVIDLKYILLLPLLPLYFFQLYLHKTLALIFPITIFIFQICIVYIYIIKNMLSNKNLPLSTLYLYQPTLANSHY